MELTEYSQCVSALHKHLISRNESTHLCSANQIRASNELQKIWRSYLHDLLILHDTMNASFLHSIFLMSELIFKYRHWRDKLSGSRSAQQAKSWFNFFCRRYAKQVVKKVVRPAFVIAAQMFDVSNEQFKWLGKSEFVALILDYANLQLAATRIRQELYILRWCSLMDLVM